MEITLIQQAERLVLVTCDSQSSHTFDWLRLIPQAENDLPQPLDDPVAYGKTIYAALSSSETPARRALDNAPERILLVCTDSNLDAVPWEYIYGRYGSEDCAPRFDLALVVKRFSSCKA